MLRVAGRAVGALGTWVIAVLAVGCGGATEPEVASGPITPTLTEFHFREADPRPGWALELMGRVAPGTRMTEEQYVPVTVRTSAGAEISERLAVGRICQLDDGKEYRCGEMLLVLRGDRSPDELMPLLNQLEAAYVQLSVFSTFTVAFVKLFSGDIREALKRLSAHPAVSNADVAGFFTIPEPLPFDPDSVPFPVFAYVRTVADGAVRSTASLAVSSGTVVTAEYTQPDGSVLRASITIQ